MKRTLLGAIRLYWRFWPARWKRPCLFRDSCSRHVYRVTDRSGVVAGLGALRRRLRQCRPGFVVAAASGRYVLRLRDGTEISHDEIGPELLDLYRAPTRLARRRRGGG